MKKFLMLSVFALVAALFMSTHTNATNVSINGTPVAFVGAGPVIVDGRTLVPIRGVFEQLGFDIAWNPEARIATLTRGTQSIVIVVGSSTFMTNGTPFALEVPAQIIGGSTMIPLRAVLETLGYGLGWDAATQTAMISTQGGVPVAAAQAPAAASNITVGNVVPRPPARSGGPANPPISAQRAVELARDHLIAIGVTSARFDYVYMDVENGVWVWSVEFDGQGRSFEFYVNVNTGGFLQAPMSAPVATVPTQPVQPTAPQQVAPAASNITIGNVVPRSPARSGGPANPPISAQRAVELARDHLVAIGVTSARFDYVYMDIENGVWVWSVEFDGQGRSFEFYVNVNTGGFLQAPAATQAVQPVAPQPAATPQPTPGSWASPSPGVSQASPSPGGGQGGGRPTNPAISLDRAIELGHAELARRGLSGTLRSNSGMDFERGQWVWELLFNVPGGGRLPFVEMYINVHTGDIVKFEWDD
ncbi:MAG: stalk domain-containing protein [Turicibacter sp.]|nr:stalk domain-containing protein [Turicibacter sp.]